ncbi:MAG: Biopolymer transport protein ExbB [Alphaproteobacteria bacterium MarineAlpha9_Bin5]|nr:MAG: Biopolymer transport protein ExbB [Alphaproteobacteria bacterium MarineAlpha9_Bin5]HHZ68639.1 MotA/TolQ/ExbB proton channel family protein [Alphaproteobacteria bacterium]HIA20842.1 MotA/TolQ/ExbB proton channel family protein [Alphaproteobacteria bacterium]HIN92895.1 MotA/TolQ/ExbB proton channel family protein [Alphaproteobacteria bacterium]
MDESPAFNTGIGLLDKGGPVMLVLLALSVVALTIILVKIYQFSRSRLLRTEFIDQAVLLLHNDGPDTTLLALAETPHPVARVMETTLRTSTNTSLSIEDRDTEISRVGSAEIRNLESYLRGLEVIANLSPLLGLLGTVLGMIKAFARLESAGTKVDPAILAGGIWEALLTTAFGLSVAIPALAAFYILEGQVENVRAQMKDATIRVLGILSSR